jgi:hypothetical protein
MAGGKKLLEKMRDNPRDWRIEDVCGVCRAFGIECEKPPAGSHYGVSHPSQIHHLTVPHRRPIKPVYIRKLVQFVDRVIEAGNGEQDDG